MMATLRPFSNILSSGGRARTRLSSPIRIDGQYAEISHCRQFLRTAQLDSGGNLPAMKFKPFFLALLVACGFAAVHAEQQATAPAVTDADIKKWMTTLSNWGRWGK